MRPDTRIIDCSRMNHFHLRVHHVHPDTFAGCTAIHHVQHPCFTIAPPAFHFNASAAHVFILFVTMSFFRRAARSHVHPDADAPGLHQQLSGWMKDRCSRDLIGLLADVSAETTWKTAPRASTLSSFSDLSYRLVSLARPYVLSERVR